MTFLIIYILGLIIISIFCGYFSNEFEIEASIVFALLWPIIVPCILIFFVICFPYVLGKYYRQQKEEEIKFIDFIKNLFK